MILARLAIYLRRYRRNLPDCDAAVKFITNLANKSTNISLFRNFRIIISINYLNNIHCTSHWLAHF